MEIDERVEIDMEENPIHKIKVGYNVARIFNQVSPHRRQHLEG